MRGGTFFISRGILYLSCIFYYYNTHSFVTTILPSQVFGVFRRFSNFNGYNIKVTVFSIYLRTFLFLMVISPMYLCLQRIVFICHREANMVFSRPRLS
jgi:hypothetical protein